MVVACRVALCVYLSASFVSASSVQAGAIKPVRRQRGGKRRCDIRAGGAKAAICHHLLRRRARHRAVAAQPRAGGADRRALHLFPVLRVPAVARDARRIPGAGQAGRQVQCRLRPVEGGSGGPARRNPAGRAEGHEIASHACGHFDGKGWSKADWLNEFASFKRILRDAYAINGIDGEPADWRSFADSAVSGFRAPYLATSKALYGALETAGFAYDASGISRGPVEPQSGGGVERFALPQIPEGPAARRVIAMDYNLFVRHSGGFERPDEAAAFQERSYEAFKAAFDAQYEASACRCSSASISR